MVSIDLEYKEVLKVLCLFLIKASKRYSNLSFRLKGIYNYTLDLIDPKEYQ